MTNQPVWQSRLRDPNQWKKTLSETIMWTLYALIIIKLLSVYSPGYPFIVGTPSIKEGIYWNDKRAVLHNRGDISSFAFNPTQAWIKDRYWHAGMTNTKRVVALGGDKINVDGNGNIEVCVQAGEGRTECSPHGKVAQTDSNKRPMTSWVPLGSSYILKPGEVWMMGEHVLSLDSRYHGPLQLSDLQGTAHLLIGWD